MTPLIISAALWNIAGAGVPLLGDIALKWLKRYAETLGDREPELVERIHATIANRDNAAVSQLIHELRERKKRKAAGS